jgi:hypothetical protein
MEPCSCPAPTIEVVAITNSKIYKIAGLSLVGFCAVSLGVDRANVGPVVSQLAGFGGAFLGALVAQRQVRSMQRRAAQQQVIAQPAATEPEKAAPEKLEANVELSANGAVKAQAD